MDMPPDNSSTLDRLGSAVSNLETSLIRFESELLISRSTLFCIVFFFLSGLCFVISCPAMFCCARVRRKKRDSCLYSGGEVLCSKKGLFTLMLARLDEFDSLTPLISTPSTASDSIVTQQPQLLKNILRNSSDSPPPPRRSLSGKTLIVPLNTSKYRAPLAPLLGTPDSRITSFEGGTTRSCATIQEDDEEDEEGRELLSIDRTSASLLSDRKLAPRSFYYYPSGYNLTLPQQPPEYQSESSGYSAVQLPAPTYSPPSAPIESRCLSPQQPHSLGSEPSTGSPIDTTASLSDSFYINSDVISSAAGSQTIDVVGSATAAFDSLIAANSVNNETGILEGSNVDVEIGKFSLHRIEEEVEGEEKVDESQAMPRSVSQQFELLRRV